MSSKYQEITERIVAELDRGTAPWSKPWISRPPVNAVSGKPYRGINHLLLQIAGYPDHRWLTYKQAGDLGGNVKRGEHGTLIVFWQFVDGKEDHGADDHQKQRKIPLCRVYTVFNASQCENALVSEGGKLPDLEPCHQTGDGSAIQAARLLFSKMPDPPHLERSDIAAYVPSRDVVLMPNEKAFVTEAGWAATLAHELSHASGHERRLNRPAVAGTVMFADPQYSEEELISEISANFICAEIGVTNDVANSAAYIDHWRQKLSSDSKLIIRAASAAQKAADWVLGRSADGGGEIENVSSPHNPQQ